MSGIPEQKNYRHCIRQKEYDEIDISDAVYRLVYEHAEEAGEEDADLMHRLFSEALPRKIQMTHAERLYPWKLVLELFQKRALGDILAPDIAFWKNFAETASGYPLADLQFIRNFQEEIVSNYVPRSLRYFVELFAYITADSSGGTSENRSVRGVEHNLEETVGRVVSDYIDIFPDADISGGAFRALKRMMEQCEEKMADSCLANDAGYAECRRLANLQWEELVILGKVLNFMLMPSVFHLLDQHSLEDLIRSMNELAQDGVVYSAREKGQIASLIESEVKTYDMTVQSRDDKKRLCDALIEFERVCGEDFRELKRWVNRRGSER